MKKLFVICMLFALCVPAFASQDFGISVSLDVASTWSMGMEDSGVFTSVRMDLNPGFTLGASYLFLNTDDEIFRGGLGVSYWIPREPDIGGEMSFSDFAAYATVQVYPLRSSGTGLYFKGNLGFNVPIVSELDEDESVSGGFYFAAGVGMDFVSGLYIELLYNNYS
jgi:hypothetical protein